VITNCNTTFANCKMMNRLMCQHVGAHGSFPTPQELSRFTVPKLRSICKVGYRDQRIHRFAQKVVAGEFDLDWWDSNLPGDRYGTFESASEIVDQARSRLDSIWGFGRFSVNNTLQLAGVFSVVPVDTETRKLQAYISSALKEKEAEEEEEEKEKEKEEEEEEKEEKENEEEENKEEEEEEEKKDEENEEEEDEDEYKPTKSKKATAKPKKKKQRRRASSAMDMKKLDEATQLAFAKYSPFQFLAYWFELYDYRGRFPTLADASGLVGEPTPNEAEAMEEEKKAEALTKEEREEEEEKKGQSNKKRKRSSVEKPKKRKAATEAKNPRKEKKQKSKRVSAASKPATTTKQKKGAKDA